MNNIILALFSCLIINATASQIESLTGFRDLTFGQDREKISGLSPAELDPKGDTRYFKRDSDSLTVESLPANFIIYGFTKDKFTSVYIGFNGVRPGVEQPVLSAYTKLYGIPTKQVEKAKDGSDFRSKYVWSGEKAVLIVTVTRMKLFGNTTISVSANIDAVPAKHAEAK